MKKNNYKLPGLPSVASVPKVTAKTTPVRDSNVAKVGGFSNGAATADQFWQGLARGHSQSAIQ